MCSMSLVYDIIIIDSVVSTVVVVVIVVVVDSTTTYAKKGTEERFIWSKSTSYPFFE